LIFFPSRQSDKQNYQGNNNQKESEDSDNQFYFSFFFMLLQDGPIIPEPLTAAGSDTLSAQPDFMFTHDTSI
jgi:hypothetical protein